MRAHYLRVLGLSENSSDDDIRKAYRRLAKMYHPDKNPFPGAQEKFIEITEAYDVLMGYSTPKRRNAQRTSASSPKTQTRSTGTQEQETARRREDAKKRAQQFAQMSYEQFSRTPFYKTTGGILLRMGGCFLVGVAQLILIGAAVTFFDSPYVAIVLSLFFVPVLAIVTMMWEKD